MYHLLFMFMYFYGTITKWYTVCTIHINGSCMFRGVSSCYTLGLKLSFSLLSAPMVATGSEQPTCSCTEPSLSQ